MNSDLITVLTAMNLEYLAVRRHLTNLEDHRHEAGTRFEVGRLAGSGVRVALALTGKGNHAAAVLAERAIAQFSPVALMFVGVAGALRQSLALGDVVVATHVYAYHGGTDEDDGLKSRPRVWEIPHAVDQIARQLDRSDEWRKRLPDGLGSPKVRFGSIAAGEVVQNSVVSDHARWVRDHYNDALAIEMEAAGVAQAAHLNAARSVVVRGISDMADGTKTASDADDWQPKAAANAAAFAISLAETLIREIPRTHADTQRRQSAEMTPATNIARDSIVGVMAKNIRGSVQVTQNWSVRRSPAEQIAELRERLGQARAEGLLDEATYAAAQAELAVVAESIPRSDETSRSKLMVALRKLRGLLYDVADLAAKVALITTTIKGAS